MYKILVDSDSFKKSLEEEIPNASDSVLVQAMTFEGDSVGEWLIDLLIESPAQKKHLCIDSYSKFVINDSFIYSPKYLLDAKFRAEVKNTKQLITKAEEHGVQITFTNPLGLVFHKYPFRNHKKLVVIDEKVSYLGGINFSEHNFRWHDFMTKIDSTEISRLVALDFNKTITLENQNMKFQVGDSELYFLDGINSQSLYKDIFVHLATAEKSIDIFSPYISDPLIKVLQNEVRRNVSVKLITPEQNNKSIFKSLLTEEHKQGYFHMHFYKGEMSHLKAILIDRKVLIFGSSNFDFVSYYCEQEVVMVSSNEELVEQFITKILEPDLSKSTADADSNEQGSAANQMIYSLALRIISSLAKIKHYFNEF